MSQKLSNRPFFKLRTLNTSSFHQLHDKKQNIRFRIINHLMKSHNIIMMKSEIKEKRKKNENGRKPKRLTGKKVPPHNGDLTENITPRVVHAYRSLALQKAFVQHLDGVKIAVVSVEY